MPAVTLMAAAAAAAPARQVVSSMIQWVALSRPALCEVIPFARGHGDKLS